MMIIIFFILTLISSLHSASLKENYSIKQILAINNSPSSNIFELLIILKKFSANITNLADIDSISTMIEEYQKKVINFFSNHSPCVILKLLNGPSHDLGLLLFYLRYWLGAHRLPPLELDYIVLACENFSGGWLNAFRASNWIIPINDLLFIKIWDLTLGQPNQDSIEELKYLLISFKKLQAAQSLFSLHYPGIIKPLDPQYPHIVQFWKLNLSILYHFASLDLHTELYSVINDLLFEFKTNRKDNLESEKLNKVIYLNFLVQKLYIQFSSDDGAIFTLISWNDAMGDRYFTIKQVLLILICNEYKTNPLKMYDFMWDFSMNDFRSKSKVEIKMKSLTFSIEKIYGSFQSQDQIKITNFISRLQRFSGGKVVQTNKSQS